MKKRKSILSVLLVGAMLFGLTACGNSSTTETNSTSSTKTASNSGDKVIYIYQNKAEIQDALQKVCDTYTKSHPGVTFVCESASDNYSTSLKTKFQGGDAPDIFSISGYSDVLLWKSQLADLTGEAFTKDMLAASAENATVEDKVYAFPLSVEGMGYVYNTKLFEKAGITETPKTKEELSKDVAALKAIGVAEPLSETYMDWYQLGNFLISLGFSGQEDPMKFIDGLNDGSESFVGNKVFDQLADFIPFEYDLSTNPSTTDFNTQTSLVGSQDMAITIGGNWSQPTYDAVDKDLPVSLMGIPYSEDEKANDQLYLATTYWGVNKDSKNLAEVKDFLDWLVTTDEGKNSMTKTLQLIPAYTNMQADTDSIGALGQTVVKYMNEGKVGNIYNTHYPDGFAQAAGEAVQKYGMGQSTKEEFLKTLQSSWDSLSE